MEMVDIEDASPALTQSSNRLVFATLNLSPIRQNSSNAERSCNDDSLFLLVGILQLLALFLLFVTIGLLLKLKFT